MPTVIGVVFFCLGVYFFLFKEDALFGLLIMAAAFQASSAINIAERGIPPYYLIAIFIIARAFVKWALVPLHSHWMPCRAFMLAFGMIAVAGAFVLPIVFAGIPVYDPKVGIDDGLLIRPALRLGLNNFGQAGFLAVHIALAYALPALNFSYKKSRRAYFWAFYLVSFIIFAQASFQLMGSEFPSTLFRNNPGYALQGSEAQKNGTRNPGTFEEPSFVGGFLLLYCIGFLTEYLRDGKRTAQLVVSIIVTGLVASTGSLFVLCAIFPVLLFIYSPFRFDGRLSIAISSGKIVRILWIILLIGIPTAGALVAFAGYRDLLTSLTISKGDSASFLNRTISDLYGLQLLAQSHGLGVGLGSSRSSSMFATLLSNAGIPGFVLFGVFYVWLFASLPKAYSWLRWGALAILLNMLFSIADVTMPMLWIPILFAIQVNAKIKVIPEHAMTCPVSLIES